MSTAQRAGSRQGRISLPPVRSDDRAEAVRREIRAFLDDAMEAGRFTPSCDSWMTGFDPEFSREVAARGWVGMTLPRCYGGGERRAIERHVVLEETLAAGAPVAAHWIADRQSATQILRHGTDEARERFLPAIARGECYFALGMSESEAGSDLASVRTTATPCEGGWKLSGTKLWTSHAHRGHFITVLCRTSPPETSRHAGLSVLIADLAAPGVTVRPIEALGGRAEFNEVVFEDVLVDDSMLLGGEGDGWRLVTSELSLERSGPERFLSTFPLYAELVSRTRDTKDSHLLAAIGSLTADLWGLRQMSLSVASILERGHDPVAEAAIVKDVGTRVETRIIEVARMAFDGELALDSEDTFERLLVEATFAAPGFTLRGGTSEILRGIVARNLG